MKESRLNDLIEKCKNQDITNNELMEVLSSTLQSLSRHSKEIKAKIDEQNIKLDKIIDMLENSPEQFFGRIIEEPDQD